MKQLQPSSTVQIAMLGEGKALTDLLRVDFLAVAHGFRVGGKKVVIEGL